jgi:lysozyme
MNAILDKAADFTSQFEGFSANPYLDSAGIATFGYGSTIKYHPKQIFPISKEDAKSILKLDLISCLSCVTENVTRDLTENQVVALIDFIYNIGKEAFIDSTMLKLLNSNCSADIASNEFPRWNKAGGEIVEGLVKRREAERELFLTN